MKKKSRNMYFYEMKAILKGLDLFLDLWDQENHEKTDNIGFLTSFSYNNVSIEEGERGVIIKDEFLK